MAHPPHPDPSAIISRTIRTDVELPEDISEVELVQYRLERELRDARDRDPCAGGCDQDHRQGAGALRRQRHGPVARASDGGAVSATNC